MDVIIDFLHSYKLMQYRNHCPLLIFRKSPPVSLLVHLFLSDADDAVRWRTRTSAAGKNKTHARTLAQKIIKTQTPTKFWGAARAAILLLKCHRCRAPYVTAVNYNKNVCCAARRSEKARSLRRCCHLRAVLHLLSAKRLRVLRLNDSLLRRRAERIVGGSTMVGQDGVGIGDFVLLEVIDADHFMQNLQKRYTHHY